MARLSLSTIQQAFSWATAKWWSLPASAPAFGTSLRLLVSSFLILSLINCTSEPNPKVKEPSFEDLDAEAESEEDLENITESVQKQQNYQTPHPKDGKPWSLKSMIVTENHPEEVELAQCRSEIITIAKDSFNEESLLIAQSKLEADVGQKSKFYHWCFYYSMMIVDEKLKQDALGQGIDQRLQNFNLEMKSLWILASTLDTSNGQKNYFNYLRSRYLSISKEYFARELHIHQRPLSKPTKQPAQNTRPPS